MPAEWAVLWFRKDYLIDLNQWLYARDRAGVSEGDIPKIGYIVLKDSIPVCAAFLRECEGGVGMLEGLVSNPDLPLFTRHLGVECVIDRLLQEAKSRHIRRLVSFSVDDSTVKRVSKRGFQKQPHVVMTLALS